MGWWRYFLWLCLYPEMPISDPEKTFDDLIRLGLTEQVGELEPPLIDALHRKTDLLPTWVALHVFREGQKRHSQLRLTCRELTLNNISSNMSVFF